MVAVGTCGFNPADIEWRNDGDRLFSNTMNSIAPFQPHDARLKWRKNNDIYYSSRGDS
jgi:hypothetical protein